MAIPTMAIGCSMSQSNSGPGIIESIKEVTDAIEAVVMSPPEMPTHLGMGLRFGLSRIGGAEDSASTTLDLECRIDLLSFELGSSGAPCPRPMPAVHINSHLGQTGTNGDSEYLYGGPGESIRLRSVDLNVTWNQDSSGASVWDASVGLNDAAFLDNVDWAALVPGRLTISREDWNAGASEVLDAFLAGYSSIPEIPAIETFFSGLHVLGLSYQSPIQNPLPNGQSIRWHLDQNAIQTFIDSTQDYIESLLQDPFGNWDLGQPLPSTGLPLGEHIASFIPNSNWNTDSNIASGGQLEIELPIFDALDGLLFKLDRYGEFELALQPLGIGPADFSASISMDAFVPESWSDGPSIELRCQMVDDVSGFLEGASLVLTRNSPWTMALELPQAKRLPKFTADGIVFTEIGPNFNLLDATERTDLLSAIPGMLLDAGLQVLVERLVLQNVGSGGVFAPILTSLGLASHGPNGCLTANSLLPLLEDPVAYLSSHVITPSGFNVPTLLTILQSLSEAFQLTTEITSNEIIHTTPEGTSVSEWILDTIQIHLGTSGSELFTLTISEHSSFTGTLSLTLGLHSSQTMLGTNLFSVNGQICLNLAVDGSVNLDGSTLTVAANTGTMIQTLHTSSGTINTQQEFLNGLISSFNDSICVLELTISGGQPMLSLDVDFDSTSPSSPSCLVELYPTVNGIDSLLKEIASSAFTAVLPELIEYGISQLDGIQILQSGPTLGNLIRGILSDLDVWDSSTSQINLNAFGELCSHPSDYLKSSNRLQLLVARASALVLSLVPQSSSPLLMITQNSDSGKNWTSIQLNQTNTWTSGFIFDVGDKKISGDLGFWLSYSTASITPQLAIDGHGISANAEIGYSRDSSNQWNFESTLSAHFTSPILSTPFQIQPALRFDFINNQLGVLLSSGVDTSVTNQSQSPAELSGNCFWIRLYPTNQFDYGIPNLGAMAIGAANTALDFIETVPAVQTFLTTPLYNPGWSVGLDEYKKKLRDITILGDWLVHFGICSYSSSPLGPDIDDIGWKGTRSVAIGVDPAASTLLINIREIGDIIAHYSKSQTGGKFPYPSNSQNIYDVFLRGAMDMVCEVVQGTTPLYQRQNSEFDFSINLDVQEDNDVVVFGLNFNFDKHISFDIGGLKLELFTREPLDGSEYETWDAKSQGDFAPGLTLQLLQFNRILTTTGSPFDPYFSLEIGHLALRLSKKDRKPLLDGFLLLNAITLTTCVDFTFTGTAAVEFGGRIDLDDFGISLGGDGSTDGGNGMAAGVLSGGDDGEEAIRPTFDLSVSKYHHQAVKVHMHGAAECWFPINKQFGPVKIAQIGVKIYAETYDDGSGSTDNEPRIAILLDGEAEIAGFLAQVDDLSVSMPLFKLSDVKGERGSNGWKYDMAGCAIAYTGPAFEIAGALRKTVLTDADNKPYVEYQGLCTISTSTMAISAMGAFGRVPVSEGDSYVTCFVIAAIDFPIGGPPMFFVTGLAGGLGLNRQLILPEVSDVPNSPFIRALSGFGDDPMGALESIREALPAKRGSLWFAVGVKFKSFQVIETKAVLFVKISDGFTIGILGTSTLHLPTEALNIGYVELAFLAYYDSAENLLWVQAQLTDASYLFDKNCRLTGGFALVSWFSRGEFVLSVGGYHPKFKAPSYYPEVPRLGINWKPMSKLTIKGGAYFTVCTSAVMLGGGLEATFKAGALSASFRAGVDVLVVFDPFYYSFGIYIGVSVRLKTWLGTLKASLGADLQIEGPKMRGTAKIDVGFISFTVKFGPSSATDFKAIGFDEFVNKHVLQLSENLGTLATQFNSECFSAQIPEGLVRCDDGNERSGTQTDPWVVVSEFELFNSHIFPASSHTVKAGTHEISSAWRMETVGLIDEIKMAPCGIDHGITSDFTLNIVPLVGGSTVNIPEGISAINKATHFPETVWRCEMKNGRPVALKKPSVQQPKFLTGVSLLFRACSFPRNWMNTTSMDQVKKSTFIHNLPLRKGNTSISTPVFEELGPKFVTTPVIDTIKEQRTLPASLQDILAISGDTERMMINQEKIRFRAEATSTQVEHDFVELENLNHGGMMR